MYVAIPFSFFKPWVSMMSRYILQMLGAATFCMQMNFAVAADDWEKPAFDGGVSRKEAAQIAFPEFEIAYLDELAGEDNLALSSWSHCNACFVVAVLENEDLNSMTLSVAVLQRDRNTVKRLAASEFKLEEFNGHNYILFDLAPYRIRDNEFAFGVRITSSYESDAHIDSWSTLHLFRLSGDKIARIVGLGIYGTTIEPGRIRNSVCEVGLVTASV